MAHWRTCHKRHKNITHKGNIDIPGNNTIKNCLLGHIISDKKQTTEGGKIFLTISPEYTRNYTLTRKKLN